MSLGGSKAVFEFSNVILISATFVKLYMLKVYFQCYFTSKGNTEYNFTVLQMADLCNFWLLRYRV